jgi:alpha-mannosidase
MAPLERIEDHHNFTWGALGYNLLDAAEKRGRAALDASLAHLAGRINSGQAEPGPRTVTVFNPSGWPRSGLVATGRIYPIPGKDMDVVIKDSAGRTLPTQILRAERDPQGNLTLADVAFVAEKVPAVGYDTYYLDFAPAEKGGQAPFAGTARTEGASPPFSAVRLDVPGLMLENEHVRVVLDPATGGVRSLVAKPSGRETLDGAKGAFPWFTGRPNAHHSLRPNPPAAYDSSKSHAQIDWLERGPLRATVRARHLWPRMTFETRVSLTAGTPYVEVLTRLLARIPPQSDAAAADIKEGYWFSLAPTFEPASVVRDFPLAIEPTKKDEFHALTFVDLVGKDVGLLLLHAGTQWFRRGPRGVLSNLVMREWESLFTHEYGWPIYAEYRHALLPHSGDLTNADRLRASAAMSQPLLVRLGSPQAGDLPAAKGFVTVAPDSVQLSALRRKAGAGLEVRVVEVEGRAADAGVELALPVAAACETDLLGVRVADVARQASRLDFAIQPWKIRTFEIT